MYKFLASYLSAKFVSGDRNVHRIPPLAICAIEISKKIQRTDGLKLTLDFIEKEVKL